MNDATFGIAILLAIGLLFAKVAQRIRLPSVTGFILAGVVLGPSGFGLITIDSVGHKLDHFTEMALMLIAFGIGEHIELRRLGSIAKDVSYISVTQAVATFLIVTVSILITTFLVNGIWSGLQDQLVLSLLLGAVAVATAPAAVLHVVRETGARGILTSTLMAVVAVDDGLAIMFFGIAIAACHQIVGQGDVSPATAIFSSFSEITLSLGIGVLTGFLLDFTLKKLHNRGEMLTVGLALLLLCGETTRAFHLSPLLAGMSAGFTIINRAERDVRLFRTINAFEPPIYVLFFTLAGVHLDLSTLKLAGWVGLVYFLTRTFGKYFGTVLGGILSGAKPVVRNYLGLALIPQAGVAIGLIFIINGDPQLASWSTIITPVVLANVVLSELIGPLGARYTIEKAGEMQPEETRPECGGLNDKACDIWLRSPEGISLPPWLGDKLHPPTTPNGLVAFGAHKVITVRALARVATILAHHYHALPLSIRVFNKEEKNSHKSKPLENLFSMEIDEVKSLGYDLKTEVIYDAPASGLVSAVEYNNAHLVILGYPLGGKPLAFQKVLEKVFINVTCPVIAVHFVGSFSFEKILVPFLEEEELIELTQVLEALTTAGLPRITFLQLLNHDSSKEEIAECDKVLEEWLDTRFFDIQTSRRVEAAESRLETILEESKQHDLIVMAAAKRSGLKRMFFGSLANSVVENSKRSMLVVFTPEHQNNNPMHNS